MDKNRSHLQTSNIPSQRNPYPVLSDESHENLLALVRALARQAVDEYLDGIEQQ